MTAISALHQTEIDGVRCLWIDSGRPTLAAQLLFRQGICDEPLHESGWLHLMEHLTLHGKGGGSLQVNGSVGMLVTTFDAHGPADLVAAHLSAVTSGLASLDPDELERERRVLRAESELRAHAVQRAFGWRYGARGPGVLSYAEPGLGRATVSALSARAARVFTRGNAVLALDGPPPTGLRLDLPGGVLLAPPTAVPCETDFPAAYRDAPGGVIVSGVVPRSSSATLVPDLLEKAIRRELRDSAGGAYAPWATYEPVDAERAVVLAGSDLLPDMQKGIAGRLTEALSVLRRQGPPPEDLEQLVQVRLQALDDPYGQFGLALRGAHQVLGGREPETRDEIRADLVGTDLAVLREDFAELLRTALYGLPPVATNPVLRELEFAFEPPRADGTRYRNINWPAEEAELVIGRDRVEMRFDHGARVADVADLAGLMQFPDGARHLVRSDGYGFTVDPRWWHRGPEAVAALDSIIPEDRHLPGPHRELEPVTRASAYKRFRARIRRWADNPVVAAIVLLLVIGTVGLFAATGRWFGVILWGWAGYAIVRDMKERRDST
jgi:hypothetical protein